MSLIKCWFDGACIHGNPGGHGGWGAIIELPPTLAEIGTPLPTKDFPSKLITMSGYCGCGPKISNNVAEYMGLIAVLNKLVELDGQERLSWWENKVKRFHPITIHSDSQLVVNQISGNWAVNKNTLCYPHFQLAERALKHLGLGRVEFKWIPRTKNIDCDALSRRELVLRGLI